MKSLKLPVSPDTSRLMSIATAPHGMEVEPLPFSAFTERLVDLLEAKYPPISREILSDCVNITKKECVRAAILATADRLTEYEAHSPIPVPAITGLCESLADLVKAIMEGK